MRGLLYGAGASSCAQKTAAAYQQRQMGLDRTAGFRNNPYPAPPSTGRSAHPEYDPDASQMGNILYPGPPRAEPAAVL